MIRETTEMLIENLDDEFDKLSDQAIQLIRSEARFILKQRSELDEFVMAMGSFFFTSKSDDNPSINNIIDEEDLNEPEFYEMIWQLNEKFNCTGFPMRFTANGDEINNW